MAVRYTFWWDAWMERRGRALGMVFHVLSSSTVLLIVALLQPLDNSVYACVHAIDSLYCRYSSTAP